MIAGAGGNIGVQIGDDGIVVVDAGSSASAADVLAAIQKLSPRPIRYIIDTSADPDHVGGNETLSKAGQTLFTDPRVDWVARQLPRRCRVDSLRREGVVEDERANRADVAVPGRGVADRDFRSRSQVHVPQRRGDRNPASARCAHRWRCRRLLPPLGRRRRGRHSRHDPLPGDRRRARRHDRRGNRRAQPDRRPGDSIRADRLARSRHDRDSRATDGCAISSTSSNTATWSASFGIAFAI